MTIEENESLAEIKPLGLSDLDKALVDAAEEMTFDWPELVPVGRIASGIREIALGALLAAGLVVLGGSFFFSL